VIDYLAHFVNTVLLAVGALLPIIDPLGGAPIYLAMTAGLRPEHRGPMAKAVAVNSFFLLIASVLVGAYVLASSASRSPPSKSPGGWSSAPSPGHS
jgi:multiple antibiotic resistance protein